MFVFGGGVTLPSTASTMIAGSQTDLIAIWDRQVGCPGQYDPAFLPRLWVETIAADPTGATWGPGVERAPRVPNWDFNKAFVAKIQTPTLMISGAHDGVVVPERVRALYADLDADNEGVTLIVSGISSAVESVFVMARPQRTPPRNDRVTALYPSSVRSKNSCSAGSPANTPTAAPTNGISPLNPTTAGILGSPSMTQTPITSSEDERPVSAGPWPP